VPSIVQATQQRLRVCMAALKDVSRVWLVAKMVYTLFESILGNKVLEERLQKAAGRRHKKMTEAVTNQLNNMKRDESAKRKYDDMALDFGIVGPAPQESYERSRPQTPAREMGQPSTAMGAPPTIKSPPQRQSDTFMGGSTSRPHTRPPTPFNPSFSVPATPPDLYLVTRNSPNLSQAIWENFQPDQLFPDGSANLSIPQFSPPQSHHNVDPNLMPQMQTPNMQGLDANHAQPGQVPQRMRGSSASGSISGHIGSPIQPGMMNPNIQNFQPQPGVWRNDFSTGIEAHSPSDSWSSASAQPSVPTTLNVEDWFQFFGINGDLSGMNSDVAIA